MLDPNQIFEMTKKDMIQSLEGMDLENVLNQKELALGYFEFIESLQHLMELKNKHNREKTEESASESSSFFNHSYPVTERNTIPHSETESNQINKIDQGTPIQAEKEPSIDASALVASTAIVEEPEVIETATETDLVIDRKMYFFERKALGGFINELKAIVPESIVARLKLEHGDYLFADEIPQTDGYSKKKYRYELAKKGTTSKDVVRIQHNFCPIERNGSLLVVSKSYENGNIRIDDVPQALVISEQDIQFFSLEEGQLVDIAYIKGKEYAPRVVYRHETESIQDDSKKTGRKKVREKDPEREEEAPEQTLEGKTVLVIGNEPDKSLYKHNVEERGGDFLWADGKDSVDSFEPLVRKSHVVVFLLAVSGHTAMKHVKRLCKEYDIPFMTTFNISSTTIIRLAENCDPIHAEA